MKVEIRRIGVLRTGVILAALYGFMAIIMVPIMIIAASVAARQGKESPEPFGMLCMLILYPLMGFIFGIIMAALYNLVVKATGGMQMEMDVEPVRQYNPAPTTGTGF